MANLTLSLLAIALSLTLLVVTATTAYAQKLPQSQNTTNNTALTNNNTTTTNATSLNATTTNATTTQIITNLTYFSRGGQAPYTVQFSPEVIQFQQTDSTFAKLVQLTKDCIDLTNEIISRPVEGFTVHLPELNQKSTCDTMITQGVEQFCTFESSDVAKCNAAKEVTDFYMIASSVVDTIS